MNVFISYSVEDIELVRQVTNRLRDSVDNILWWDERKDLGEDSWSTINKWVDQSEIVLAIITDHGIHRGMAIGNEIGYAKAKDKIIIPLIGPKVESKDLGCLHGVTYQRIDRDNPDAAIFVVKKKIEEIKEKKIKDLQIRVGFLLAVGAIIGILASKE